MIVLFKYFLFCILIYCFLWFLVILLNGMKLPENIDWDSIEAEKRKKRRSLGPSENEKYKETLRLYKEANPMIQKILNRSEKEILQMVLDPKYKDIRIVRDMYRLSAVFGFTIPELQIKEIFTLDGVRSELLEEESRKKLEEWRRKIGVSKIYDDPFESIDPYEQWDSFLSRSEEVAKEYGYWENSHANIFKTNEIWWDGVVNNERL